MKVLVEHIRRGAVGQQPERNRALLQRRKSGSADAIFPILEVFITSLQRLDNAKKKFLPYSETSVKNGRAPPWLLSKIVCEQTLVSYVVFVADKRPASNQPLDLLHRFALALHFGQAFHHSLMNAIE